MEHGTETWKSFLADGRKLVGATTPYQVSGRLTRINGLVMEASGLKLPLAPAAASSAPASAPWKPRWLAFTARKSS
jgi:flagellum-specific ATP synthase